jgi:hypothetical protein
LRGSGRHFDFESASWNGWWVVGQGLYDTNTANDGRRLTEVVISENNVEVADPVEVSDDYKKMMTHVDEDCYIATLHAFFRCFKRTVRGA